MHLDLTKPQVLSNLKALFKSDALLDADVLLGIAQIVEATNNPLLKNVLFKQKEFILNDKTIYKKSLLNYKNVNIYKVLLYTASLTKDESGNYNEKDLIDLNNIIGKIYSSFDKKDLVYNDSLKDTYYYLPLLLSYETLFNQKARYADLVNTYRYINASLADRIKNDYQALILKNDDYIYYMMGLIDSLNATSKEIFEQYRTLEILFKEAVSGIIKNDQSLFVELNRRQSLYLAYIILKATRLEVISSEKYQMIGKELFDKAISAISENELSELNELDIILKDSAQFMMCV